MALHNYAAVIAHVIHSSDRTVFLCNWEQPAEVERERSLTFLDSVLQVTVKTAVAASQGPQPPRRCFCRTTFALFACPLLFTSSTSTRCAFFRFKRAPAASCARTSLTPLVAQSLPVAQVDGRKGAPLCIVPSLPAARLGTVSPHRSTDVFVLDIENFVVSGIV